MLAFGHSGAGTMCYTAVSNSNASPLFIHALACSNPNTHVRLSDNESSGHLVAFSTNHSQRLVQGLACLTERITNASGLVGFGRVSSL